MARDDLFFACVCVWYTYMHLYVCGGSRLMMGVFIGILHFIYLVRVYHGTSSLQTWLV